MEDFNLAPGKPTISTDIEKILQQIDILFDCTPGELQGDVGFGTEYDYLLYDLGMDENSIKQHVLSDLSGIETGDWDYNVEVYLMQGVQKDIALININFYNDQTMDRRSKTYKIE